MTNIQRVLGSGGLRYRRRRAVSEIIAVLLLVAIVVGMGVIAYSFASGSLGILGGGASGLISNQANAVAQNFAVEQAAFAFPGGTSPSPLLDGTATAQAYGASSSIGATLTTDRANDVIVADVSAENYGTASLPTISGLSGGGLTWTQRAATPSESSGGNEYVPITLTNSQTAATGNPFQQMVTWDPASYTAYEATSLGNIRFCDDVTCMTPLYAWLESCSSTCRTAGSTSTSATAWVELDTAIASGASLTIFMVFYPTTTNFDGVYWGEAPQLSSTYAQYDNGANVFTNYWNFAGTACPTGWTCSGTTENNGISSATTSYAYTTATFGLTANILDFYGDFPAATSVDNAGFGYNHDTANGPTVEWTLNTNTGGAGCASTNACLQTATGAAYHYTTTATTTGTLVYSLYWGSTASATSYYSYANAMTSTTDIPTAALSLGIYNAQGTQATIGPFNWLRLRVYPPSGVMPSTAFGTAASSNLSYVPITLTNSQTAATGNPFQQMVTFDPATYTIYEATNLGNIRFCSDVLCSSPLYAWLESCSSTCSTAGSTSTTATAWVKLTSAIAANGGTLTIYMVFQPAGTNFDGVYWGEAPTLSGIYAQYDDGANVFETYADFAGTTLPAAFATVVNAGTDTVNNGLTLSAGSTDYIHVYTTATHNPGVVELDISSVTADGEVEVAYDTAVPATGGDLGYSTDYRGGDAPWETNEYITKDVGGTGTLLAYITASSTSGLLGLEWPSTGTQNLYLNYAKIVSATDTAITYGAAHLDIFFYGDAATQSATASWFRNRVDPPSGVMPSAAFGSVTNYGALYVPITITNSQTTATPNPFQQSVTFDPATYAAYEAANLGNVRFCSDDACASPLYAWLESCSSTCSTAGSTSTSATAWVQLTSSIAASGGTLTIFMVFEPTTTTFDGVYWGEAPQLSPTYAEYDNGAKVFTFYDDFAGTTLSSLWTNNVANSGGTLTINNGMSYTRGATANNYPFLYSTSTFSQGVYETYGDIPAGGAAGTYTYAGFGLFSSTNLNAGAGVGDWNSGYGLYTGTGTADTIVTGLTGGTYIWSLFVPSSTPTSISGSQNYGTALTSTTNLPTLPYSITFADQYDTGVNVGTFNWVRDRAYPPSGVMPTTSTGSSDSSGVTLVVQEWYAIASSALSSVTITATFSSSDTAGTWITVFGLSGANTASPFDPCTGCASGAAPQTASGASNVQTTMTTSNPNDLLLYACAAEGGGLAGGYTSISSNSFAPEQNEYVGYETVSQAQTSVVTSCGGSDIFGAEITDAVAGSNTASYYGATLYVRNVGTVPVTLVSIYVVDESTNTFVAQIPLNQVVGVGALVSIPQTTLTFTPSFGNVYSFKVTSSLGQSVTFMEKAT